jgi:hypothetical protein
MFSSQPVIIDMESNFLWKEKQHIIKFSLKIWILLNIKCFFNKKELRVPGGFAYRINGNLVCFNFLCFGQ